jgi:hypothetical protein
MSAELVRPSKGPSTVFDLPEGDYQEFRAWGSM